MLKIKLLTKNARVPTRVHQFDAGLDLYAPNIVVIKPQKTVTISTQVAVSIADGYQGQIVGRSSLSRDGLFVATGTIDAGYIGALGVTIFNSTKKSIVIHEGDRIAQLVITPILIDDVVVVNEFMPTDRGTNGFGSSGK